jgi:hypothetical protein
MTCSPQPLYRDTRNAHKTLYLDGKNRATVRSTLQTGSFTKIAHWAIFKRSSLAGTGTLPRFDISAHNLHAQTNTNDTLLPGPWL